MYKYESDWSRLAYPPSQAAFASDGDIKRLFAPIDLNSQKFTACGIPLLVEGNTAYVNDEIENTIVYGETGSKKTRSLVRPLIALNAGSENSCFVIDVKGELSSDPKLMNYLEAKGTRTVCLDFRNFDHDAYNILEHAMKLYREGKTDKAMANINTIVHSLSSRYDASTADPYWTLMSEQHIIPILHMLLEISLNGGKYTNYVNMLSVATFTNESGTKALEDILDEYYGGVTHNSVLMLKSVLSAPDRTKSSIVSVTASLLRDFVVQSSLLAMLSESTFSVEEMYETPTCVFLVIPDECSAYDSIGGLLLDNFYNQLVEVYTQKYQNCGKPPCRIDFICDEFCNAKINDMKAKISASRSRFIRWVLICQSLRQLESAYKEDASTIIGNCKNVILLQSSDPEMLSYISSLCGTTTVSVSEGGEPLIPPEKLRTLKKSYEYKEAVFIRDELVYLATLPDIDQYEFLKPYADDKPYQLPMQERSTLTAYSPHKMANDIYDGSIFIPFKEPPTKRKKIRNTGMSDCEKKLMTDEKFDKLFAMLDANEEE